MFVMAATFCPKVTGKSRAERKIETGSLKQRLAAQGECVMAEPPVSFCSVRNLNFQYKNQNTTESGRRFRAAPSPSLQESTKFSIWSRS